MHRGDTSLSKGYEQLTRSSLGISDKLRRNLSDIEQINTIKKRKRLTENEVYFSDNKRKKSIDSDDIILKDIAESMQQNREYLIIVSNRGAKQYKREGQQLKEKSGAGGLSTALTNIQNYGIPVEWYSAPIGQGDREVMAEGLPHTYVNIDSTTYNEYYNEISNRIVWPMMHEMQDSIEDEVLQVPQTWESYIRANRAFADRVSDKIRKEPKMKSLVMVQDYHLLLASGMIREKNPDILLQHFIHTPWPEPNAWKRLHSDRVKHIYTNMLGNDIIGFQTENDAENFLDGVQQYLPHAKVSRACSDPEEASLAISAEEDASHLSIVPTGIESSLKERRIHWNNYNTTVRVYPISIDCDDVRKKAEGEFNKQNDNEKIQEDLETIQNLLETKGILKIMTAARIDPTKNLRVTLEGYGQMLADKPDLCGKVVFLTFLTPSREGVQIYQKLEADLRQLGKMINETYGTPDWQPLYLFFGHNQETVLKALKDYDVLAVVPIKDGMNLVVKEGPEVNKKNGVVVLSEGTGAFHQLKDGVISISSSCNVKKISSALSEALDMPEQLRKEKAKVLREAIRNYDLRRWLREQLRDMLRMALSKLR